MNLNIKIGGACIFQTSRANGRVTDAEEQHAGGGGPVNDLRPGVRVLYDLKRDPRRHPPRRPRHPTGGTTTLADPYPSIHPCPSPTTNPYAHTRGHIMSHSLHPINERYKPPQISPVTTTHTHTHQFHHQHLTTTTRPPSHIRTSPFLSCAKLVSEVLFRPPDIFQQWGGGWLDVAAHWSEHHHTPPPPQNPHSPRPMPRTVSATNQQPEAPHGHERRQPRHTASKAACAIGVCHSNSRLRLGRGQSNRRGVSQQ